MHADGLAAAVKKSRASAPPTALQNYLVFRAGRKRYANLWRRMDISRQARAHNGRRRDRDERTGQGLRVYDATARKRRQLTKDFKMLLRPVLIWCTTLCRFWHKADIPRCPPFVRFRG